MCPDGYEQKPNAAELLCVGEECDDSDIDTCCSEILDLQGTVLDVRPDAGEGTCANGPSGIHCECTGDMVHMTVVFNPASLDKGKAGGGNKITRPNGKSISMRLPAQAVPIS